ncbi:MAG: hypothetical protein LCH54_16980 [Bacteroidetes bacterium]|nr:hypothetical protein [Bacteroidota bacterium]
MTKYIAPLFLITILLGCVNVNKNTYSEKTNLEFDTLKVNYKINYCSQNKYYFKYGIYIPIALKSIDEIAIDLNHDKVVDSLIVFQYNSNNWGDSILFLDDEIPNYLVEVLNYEDQSKIRDIYPDLILNTGHLLSFYSGIYRTENGFEIIHQAGAKYSWKVIQNISTADNKKIKLRYIQKICTFDGIDSILTYNTFNTEEMEFKIKDSIQNNGSL